MKKQLTNIKRASIYNLYPFETLYALGLTYYKKGDLDKAIDSYTEALNINPLYSKAHNKQGTVFASKSMFNEAIAAYKKALEINPNFDEAFYGLGPCLQQKRNA